MTQRTLELAELVQELNKTLGILAKTGLLERLREFLRFAADSETYLDTDRIIGELTKNVGKLPWARISAALQGYETTPALKESSGGWSGLIHVLRDAEIQRGLAVLGRFFYQLSASEKST